jgi:hypothetical protein
MMTFNTASFAISKRKTKNTLARPDFAVDMLERKKCKRQQLKADELIEEKRLWVTSFCFI